ncbi:hypothetical protein B1R32_101301 [Abditibacterium utsteinense]|uniref:Uncharacterized protein n=1 Tax=Abditibacterium utsteinense TaxID=1960156 RepID=A0A2S8SXV9_9BACT|nr:hypothetical protein [Abditibacterium utsteinense]PQV65559.1 hypothetical protein B1R32_101301 [Abditibacterium utsteinense]
MSDFFASPLDSPAKLRTSTLDSSTVEAVRLLRERFPNTPFLTLGQTVLWDEPVKAAFCAIAEELENAGVIAPGARIVAGVHDTDYFAKLEGLSIRDTPFVVLRHNDGDTRGLWSAAGEISAFFGSETVPSRADFSREGVSFAKAARAYAGGAEALLNQETEAPDWRAIVHTEPHPLIAADVRLRDIEPALRQQLRWAFRHSLRALGCSEDFENDDKCKSGEIARQIWGWNDEFLAGNPDATLSDLYRHLIPKTWALVRGEAACNLETTASLQLFKFNAQTCDQARFGFVDLFLNPATRNLARRAYDDAVRGSGIYTLDGFGPGALPFDVVIPGKGRGTLRLHGGSVIVETEEPVEICENCDPETLGQLAALLETHFGPEICLVGKAVALISMLSAEYIFVFHEKASSYTSRTQKMNATLRAAGLELPLHPMLRLQYATWDALHDVEANFHLPPHLEHAFGAQKISARDFAARWQDVAKNGDERRAELKGCRSPRALMRKLSHFENQPQSHLKSQGWSDKAAQFDAASEVLAHSRVQAREIEVQIEQLRHNAQAATQKALELETRKGANFRAEIAPLRARIFDLNEEATLRLSPLDVSGKARRLGKDERAAQKEREQKEAEEIATLRAQISEKNAPRASIDAEIAELRREARRLKTEAKILVQQRVQIEKSADLGAARLLRESLEDQAELERFFLVRDAVQASNGLRYTNYRPTAWWLPMVSPDGKWFKNLTQSTHSRIEEL